VKCFRCLQEVPDDAEVCPYCGQIIKPILKIDRDKILDPSTLKEGDLIKDRFEIRQNLGSGGIGTVFKVYDTKYDVISIVKMLNREFCEDQEIRNRFFDEHRKVLEVDHENLVKYFEIDEFRGVPFIVTQYIDGIDLRKVINAKKNKQQFFSLSEIFPIFDGIAKALEKIHTFSFHGDLKPENVIITASGVKVTDYVISRVLPPQDFVSVQLALGDVYYYLSPEYITAPDQIDQKVDIYALGVILYEMLTCSIPKAEPAPPSSINPDIRGDVDEIVLKALSRDPEKRFCCIEEFHYEFGRVAGREGKVSLLKETIKKKKEEQRKAAKPEKKEEGPGVEGKPPEEEKPSKKVDLFAEEEMGEEKEEKKERKKELLFEEELISPEEEERIERKPEKKKSPLALILLILLILAGGAGAFVFLQGKGRNKSESSLTSPKTTQRVARKSIATPQLTVKASTNQVKKQANVAESKRKVEKTAQKVKVRKTEKKVASEEKKRVKETVKAEAGGKKESVSKEQKPEKVAMAKPPRCPPGMVYIPGGYFIYGSPPDDPYRDSFFDKYFGRTYIKGFCIDKYEYPNKKGAVPRSGVTYTQAYNLCKAQGKRLCTEAEWERACKGPSNNLFPYGMSFKNRACNTSEAGFGKILPSGSLPGCKSGFGVYDMSGNLLEWTATMTAQNMFVTKGGSYRRTKGESRCSARRPKAYFRHDKDIGFRCCKDANY